MAAEYTECILCVYTSSFDRYLRKDWQVAAAAVNAR
jgi:hypothetical protein